MATEFRILHHRHATTGGHWDLVENPIPHRSAAAAAPHGEGTLCAALQSLAGEGWTVLMNLQVGQAQLGESFILLSRG
jgi:hypothetical protein